MNQIITYTQLPLGLLNNVWDMYEAAMKPLRKVAIQKHVMHVDEFVHLMQDSRVVKHLGLRDGVIAGLAVSVGTDELQAWPYVEPEYLEHHWPEEYAAGKIWYVGFIVTDRRSQGLFDALRAAVAAPVRAVAGMAFMDFCDYNEQLGLVQASTQLAKDEDKRLRVRRVDSQGYWIFWYEDADEFVAEGGAEQP